MPEELWVSGDDEYDGAIVPVIIIIIYLFMIFVVCSPKWLQKGLVNFWLQLFINAVKYGMLSSFTMPH